MDSLLGKPCIGQFVLLSELCLFCFYAIKLYVTIRIEHLK